jgi:hypothetical protein
MFSSLIDCVEEENYSEAGWGHQHSNSFSVATFCNLCTWIEGFDLFSCCNYEWSQSIKHLVHMVASQAKAEHLLYIYRHTNYCSVIGEENTNKGQSRIATFGWHS